MNTWSKSPEGRGGGGRERESFKLFILPFGHYFDPLPIVIENDCSVMTEECSQFS